MGGDSSGNPPNLPNLADLHDEDNIMDSESQREDMPAQNIPSTSTSNSTVAKSVGDDDPILSDDSTAITDVGNDATKDATPDETILINHVEDILQPPSPLEGQGNNEEGVDMNNPSSPVGAKMTEDNSSTKEQASLRKGNSLKTVDVPSIPCPTKKRGRVVKTQIVVKKYNLKKRKVATYNTALRRSKPGKL